MTFHVYIGYDAIDHAAFRVLEESILSQSYNVAIHPLRDWELRQRKLYYRRYYVTECGQKVDFEDVLPFSTDFSYSRFLTPLLHSMAEREGPALFMDADMMLRGDIRELFGLSDGSCDVMVVQNNHTPKEATKIAGLLQKSYPYKNWSSVMLFPKPSNIAMSIGDVSTKNRQWLHSLAWATTIGPLPGKWNWLEGSSDEKISPRIVHYTRGTPDLPGYGDVAYASEWWLHAKNANYHHQEL